MGMSGILDTGHWAWQQGYILVWSYKGPFNYDVSQSLTIDNRWGSLPDARSREQKAGPCWSAIATTPPETSAEAKVAFTFNKISS